MRTYRWNREQTANTGPVMCDTCREMSARHVLTTYPVWASEMKQYLCDDCLAAAVDILKRSTFEYRVAGL